jgi:hypothetical protein
MPQPQKPRPRRTGWIGILDARDRAMRSDRLMRFGPRIVPPTPPISRDDVAMPEPEFELEGSELSDRERADAIARERMRREA